MVSGLAKQTCPGMIPKLVFKLKNSISANLFLWILWLTQSLVTTIQKNLPVTGFPLASVTPTDWTVSVTGLPLAP